VSHFLSVALALPLQTASASLSFVPLGAAASPGGPSAQARPHRRHTALARARAWPRRKCGTGSVCGRSALARRLGTTLRGPGAVARRGLGLSPAPMARGRSSAGVCPAQPSPRFPVAWRGEPACTACTTSLLATSSALSHPRARRHRRLSQQRLRRSSHCQGERRLPVIVYPLS
jgi:hypothetical protein